MNIFNRRQALVVLSMGMVLPSWAKTATPALLLAQNYAPGVDVSQYWVSEKLDGVRALWDGKVLKFRSGKLIAAPAWFLAKLPGTPLDGELWMGRGSFDVLSGTVRKVQPVDEEWKRVQYWVFESPAGQGDFTQRIEQIKSTVAKVAWPQLQAVAHKRIANEIDLQKELKTVVAAGGEGLMLHLASSAYVTGRSSRLLKLKVEPDAEAKVVAHQAGRGKYEGMLGALVLQTESGQRFRLGTGFSDEQRKSPPPVGSVVTYSYRGLTPNGLPRFASFVRVRGEE